MLLLGGLKKKKVGWGAVSSSLAGGKGTKKLVTKNNLPPPFPPSSLLALPLLWRSSFRFSPMVFLYLSTVIPSIWFLELSLLQSKLPVNNSSGPGLHLLAHIPITAVGVPSHNCPPRSHIKATPDTR